MTPMQPLPRLEHLRERAGLTQSLLARRAGISSAVIRRAENGAAVFPDTMRALARALGVAVEDLLAESQP